jgi:hypothetical protein
MSDTSVGVPPSLGSTHSRAWLLGALGLVFLRAIPNLRYPLGRDQATHSVMGQGLLHGQLLYRDLCDVRPPGISYIYALIVKVFGPVMWSVGVVDILWLLVICYCVFRFAQRYLGAPAAALATVFFASWHCTFGYISAVQPESVVTLLVFPAYFLLLPGRRWPNLRHFAAGLMMGGAFWSKYNAVMFFPFLVLLPHLDLSHLDREPRRVGLKVPLREWLALASLVVAGFATAVAAVLGYFWWAGVWPALKEVQFEVLPRYGAMVFERHHNYVRWALVQTYAHVGPWTEAIAAVTLAIAWWRRELAKVTPVVLMGLAGYATVAAQGRFHPYYFETVYPFLAMFWGYACLKIYEGFNFTGMAFARRGWRLARGLLWVVLANLAFAVVVEDVVRVVQHYKFLADWWRNPEISYTEYWWQLPLEKLGEQLRVINYLNKNSVAGDQVYVWGTAPLINFLSQRQSPSRFVSNLPLISLWGPARWRDELVRDLDKKRPRFIVVARHDSIPGVSFTHMDSEEYLQTFPGMANLLTSRYEPAENLWDFEIYRLK